MFFSRAIKFAASAGEVFMAKPAPQQQSSWTNTQVITAIVVVLIVGGLGGYLLHNNSSSPSPAGDSAATVQPNLQQPINPAQALDAATRPLLARLQSNPKDVAALTELGNINFDASQWTPAITYYTRALNETPHNPDVRTDMGIAYFYSGDTDRALKEFDVALKDDPRHSQTLFNVGVVREQGKKDHKGAIAAWEQLLKTDPNYRDRAKVEQLLATSRAEVK
jgi:cytochrome c-type biogenesis protein CcmH/NrfG